MENKGAHTLCVHTVHSFLHAHHLQDQRYIQNFNDITAANPPTQEHNQVSASSVHLPAGDIHHGNQRERLCDEEARI